MTTLNDDFLPNAPGLTLGTSSLPWNANLTNLFVTTWTVGTIAVTKIVPGISGLSLGTVAQPWNGQFQNLTVAGTLSVTGTITQPGIGPVAIASSASPVFDGSLGNVFTMTLTSNTTASTANLVAGVTYVFILIQDGAGSHTFTWPGNVKGGLVVDGTASVTNVQSFISRSGNLYAISAGVSM